MNLNENTETPLITQSRSMSAHIAFRLPPNEMHYKEKLRHEEMMRHDAECRDAYSQFRSRQLSALVNVLQQRVVTNLAQAKDNTIVKDQEILGKDNEIAKLSEGLADVNIKFNRKCDAFKTLKKNHLQDLKEAKQCHALPKAPPTPEAVALRTENFALRRAPHAARCRRAAA